MAHIPDYVIIKPAKTAQNWCYGIATFLSFVSIGGFSNGDGGFGWAGFTAAHDPSLKPHFCKTPESVFIGFMGKRPLYWNGMGGLLLVAGARGGKLKDILGYNILDGMCDMTLLILDQKGELAAISQNQTKSGKHCIYWNPLGISGMPRHHINPVSYIRADSPTLVADVKVFAENMISITGSANGDFFERRGREFLEAVALTIVKMDGVLTLPRLYHFLNLIPGGTDAWLDFAFEMHESGFEISRRIEEEIAQSRNNEGGGLRGILGEIFKSFAALSDPALMDSVSPPYDFSLEDLSSSTQKYNLYMMPPAEFIESWGPMIKALFVGAMIYKSRAPSAPRQTWILDELAQIASGGFPLAVKLFTYGAGIGIRPWAVVQASAQMNALGPNAETIITSSAAVRSYFAIRDLKSAETLSRMIGTESLEFNETLKQSQALVNKQQIIRDVFGGGDPLELARRHAHQKMAARHRSMTGRPLRSPDELLNTPDGKQYIFMDGVPLPLFADRRAYFEERSLAGRFHPNPYHPPIDRVRVKTLFGHRWRNIITEPVPAKYEAYPQYAGGTWSYVKGCK